MDYTVHETGKESAVEGKERFGLEKVPEVKDTVHKQSLLHHVCTMVVENFPDSSDLYSEIGAVTRSAKVRAGHGGAGGASLPQSWGSAPAISAPCSDSSAIPSSPSQPEWKIGFQDQQEEA